MMPEGQGDDWLDYARGQPGEKFGRIGFWVWFWCCVYMAQLFAIVLSLLYGLYELLFT